MHNETCAAQHLRWIEFRIISFRRSHWRRRAISFGDKTPLAKLNGHENRNFLFFYFIFFKFPVNQLLLRSIKRKIGSHRFRFSVCPITEHLNFIIRWMLHVINPYFRFIDLWKRQISSDYFGKLIMCRRIWRDYVSFHKKHQTSHMNADKHKIHRIVIFRAFKNSPRTLARNAWFFF